MKPLLLGIAIAALIAIPVFLLAGKHPTKYDPDDFLFI